MLLVRTCYHKVAGSNQVVPQRTFLFEKYMGTMIILGFSNGDGKHRNKTDLD